MLSDSVLVCEIPLCQYHLLAVTVPVDNMDRNH